MEQANILYQYILLGEYLKLICQMVGDERKMRMVATAPCRKRHGHMGHTVNITMTSYEHDGVSNHQPHDCLLNRLFIHRSKETSKLCVTGLWEGNSPVTGEFPAQKDSNAKNVSIWWRHHEK